jgi:probable phosphoglycerate mutase
MTRVYLIRHGEAEGNIYRRAQGQYDSGLTAKGLRQVDALAERFRDVRIDALYSSDLQRARMTAAAITKYHDLPLRPDPRLRELALGAWEYVPFGDLEHRFPEQLFCFNNDPDRWSAPGANRSAR